MQDFNLALQLVQEGSATLQWGPAFVAGSHQGGDAAAAFFGSALKVRPATQDMALSHALLLHGTHMSHSHSRLC